MKIGARMRMVMDYDFMTPCCPDMEDIIEDRFIILSSSGIPLLYVDSGTTMPITFCPFCGEKIAKVDQNVFPGASENENLSSMTPVK